jgi:transposase InsO family protein
LHKPVKRKFQRRQVLVNEIDDVWSCDLVEMQEWANVNKGFRYMLNVVDCFSKFAWSIPLKDKKALTVLDAFKLIVKESGRQPKHLWVDEGKEFYNKDMTAWIKEHDIVRYSTHGEHKSAVVERFNRTLKTNMWRRFTAENTRNWIDMLDKLMKKYNNKYHNTIRMKPIDASLKENKIEVWNNSYSYPATNVKAKFKVGDSV